MLKIEKLNFSYPQGFSLKINDFSLEQGRHCFIKGKSGSGKSTFLALLSGVLKAHEGTIRFNDEDISQLNETETRRLRLEKIAVIRQDFGLLNYLNVIDNILLPLRLNPQSKLSAEFKEKASKLLKELALENYEKRRITELSQGEKQRVAICRALILSPKLLLADEITANLDPENSERLISLLLRLGKEKDFSIIMVSHDHSFQESFDQHLDFNDLNKGRKS